ncbi:hypothetical protein BV20DRAFT_625845 [Pilatotrama ljubarskyi]|nr:hypothetical protein BV20DRAFT_625845 [Pilatotrama ljubarskyi]
MTNNTSVNPSEVGWQFVPQYYTFVNKHPNRLHCFYNKSSTFIHGTEGEDGKPCFGQQVCARFLWPATRLATITRQVANGIEQSLLSPRTERVLSHRQSPLRCFNGRVVHATTAVVNRNVLD